MKLSAFLAVLMLSAPAGAQTATQTAAPKRKKHPAARAAKKAAAAHAVAKAAAPAPAEDAGPVPAAPPRDEAVLGAFGAALSEDGTGLTVDEARPKSPADEMGLRAGDRVWFVDRAAPRTRAEAAAARREPAPEERESLVVRRGLETAALSGAPSPAPPDFVRGSSDLSAYEKSLASALAFRDAAAAHDAVAEAPPLDWTLRADQAFWVRFPKGLPAGLFKDDLIEVEAATGLTTDGSLDFLAVPPKSRVWARVLSVSDDGAARTVRLLFYKLRPAGGHVYPLFASATGVAGVAGADLARVSAGGTIVVAAPLPPADGKKKKGPDLLLDGDARLRVRVLDPVALVEAPSWWRAGPGLWLKTSADSSGRRRFQVTHVVAGRSAAAAGIKIGDLIDAVGGRSAEGMDFEEALDALYGAPGSAVKVSVERAGASQVLELTRGVKVEKGVSTPLPLPFETR